MSQLLLLSLLLLPQYTYTRDGGWAFQELPEPGTLTFCIGFSDQKGLVKAIKNNWDKLLESKIEKNIYPPFESPKYSLISIPKLSCSFASRANSHKVFLLDAVGLISADMICPYPPGIPFVIPGEVLDNNLVNWMINQIQFWPDQIPAQIKVVS